MQVFHSCWLFWAWVKHPVHWSLAFSAKVWCHYFFTYFAEQCQMSKYFAEQCEMSPFIVILQIFFWAISRCQNICRVIVNKWAHLRLLVNANILEFWIHILWPLIYNDCAKIFVTSLTLRQRMGFWNDLNLICVDFFQGKLEMSTKNFRLTFY